MFKITLQSLVYRFFHSLSSLFHSPFVFHSLPKTLLQNYAQNSCRCLVSFFSPYLHRTLISVYLFLPTTNLLHIIFRLYLCPIVLMYGTCLCLVPFTTDICTLLSSMHQLYPLSPHSPYIQSPVIDNLYPLPTQSKTLSRSFQNPSLSSPYSVGSYTKTTQLNP